MGRLSHLMVTVVFESKSFSVTGECGLSPTVCFVVWLQDID